MKKTRFVTEAAVIGALYVVLTFVSRLFGLDSGAIQVRISEALTAFVIFTPAAVPGLFFGCIISNLLMQGVILDVIFGSLATLIGAGLGRVLRKYKYIALIPTIIANAVIVPFVLIYAYGLTDAWWYLFVTVGIGEILSCGVLGGVLVKVLEKRKRYIFK